MLKFLLFVVPILNFIFVTVCTGCDTATYDSLDDLQKKAAENKIEFYEGLSEFTYLKLNEEALEFFKKNKALIDEGGNYAPHVELRSGFLIDTKSKLGNSKVVASSSSNRSDAHILLGQKKETGEFLAFKRPLHN